MSYLEMALRAAREMDEEANTTYLGGTEVATKATKATKAPATCNPGGAPATTKTTKAPSAPPTMPPGVGLLAWEPKPAPVMLTEMSVVNDVEGFITDKLTELGKLLASREEPERPRKLRDLVDALEQCGVIVQIRLWR